MRIFKYFFDKRIWQIAAKTRNELIFKSLLETSLGYSESSLEGDVEKALKKVLFNVKMNRIVLPIVFLMAIFALIFPILFFSEWLSESLNYPMLYIYFSLFSTYFVSIFTLFAIFGMMHSTSLFTSKIYMLLSSLPLDKKELEAISLLSFIQIYDTLLLVSIVGYPILLIIITGDVILALLIFILSIFNIMIAITVLVYLSKLFYTRVISMGGTKLKSILRTLLVIAWGAIFFGIYFFSSLATEVFPYVIDFFITTSNIGYITALLLIYPFPFAYLIASYYTSTFTLSFYVSVILSLGYMLLAIVGVSKAANMLFGIAKGELVTLPTEPAEKYKQFKIKLKTNHPIIAIIKKDFRLASRKPSYAFIFAFPVIMSIIQIFPATRGTNTESFLILMTLWSIAFPLLFFAVYFGGIDGQVSSYIRLLPISFKKTVLAKTIFFIIIYFFGLLTTLIIYGVSSEYYGVLLFSQSLLINYMLVYILNSIPLAATLYFTITLTFYKMQTKGISLITLGSEYGLILSVIVIGLVGLFAPPLIAAFLESLIPLSYFLIYTFINSIELITFYAFAELLFRKL